MPNKIILIFPFDLLSHYLRCITLANNYKEYSVLFAYSEKYDVFVKQAGFKSFKVKTFNSEEVMKCAIKFDFSWLDYVTIESIFLSQVDAIKNFNPQFVIGDTAPTLKMAAEHTQTKYVALVNGYMTKYYSNVRSLSITHPAYKHLVKLPQKYRDSITKFAEKIAFVSVHKPFRKIRKKYRLTTISNYIKELEGNENLICDEPWLFPQTNLPDNYKIIGPLIYNSTINEDDLIASLDKTKPIICVCLGSSGNWDKLSFLSSNIYSTVNIIVAGDLKEVIKGDHVFSKPFINLNKILPLCSFIICHGGNGTIYEALKHKVYILCFTSHFEQEWNVYALEKLKLGISINQLPAQTINKMIEDAITLKNNN